MMISVAAFFRLLTIALVLLSSPRLQADDKIQDIVFTATADGSQQRYVLVVSEEFRTVRIRSALIVLHGHGSDRWQFVKDARGECRGARDVARKHGMVLVSPDYRASTSWMGPNAEADLVQIVEVLRKNLSMEKIVVCGGSMGGTAALTFTALHPDLIDGVVSLNGTANLVDFPNFLDAIAASYGGSKKDKPEEYRKRSAEFFPEKFTMPIATTTGGQDKLVPPDSVLRLMEKVKQKNKQALLLHRPEGGHSTTYDDTREAIEYVVQRVLKP